MSIKVKQYNPQKNRRSIAAVVIAGLAASVCCVGPLVLLGLGIGGAWVGNLTALEPFRPYLMGLTFLALGYAFYKIYRKPKAEECEPGSYCANPKSDRINKIALWVATVFVIILLAIPYITPQLMADQERHSTDQAVPAQLSAEKVILDVPGMTCPSCPFTVQKSLERLDGVISAEVTFETKKAQVTYDPARVSIDQMVEATTNAGYPSTAIKQ